MSDVLGRDRTQLTLEFEGGLLERYSCARDAMAQGVYRRGLKRTAADLDMAPGNLSVALGGEGGRHVSLDAFERYLQTTGDLTPLHYLVARYLGDASAARDEAVSQALALLQQLPQALAAAGLSSSHAARRR